VLRGTHQSKAIRLSQPRSLIRLKVMDIDSDACRRHGLPLPAERVWRQFLATLDALPADARVVLLLHDVFGVATDEIASLIGLPAAVCRQRLERAHACLRMHARPLEPYRP